MPDDDKITPENHIRLADFPEFQRKQEAPGNEGYPNADHIKGLVNDPVWQRKIDPDDLPTRPEEIPNFIDHPELQQRIFAKKVPSDYDDITNDENTRRLDENPIWRTKEAREAPSDNDSLEEPDDNPALNSSKEKYHRLNPNFENIIKQLQIAFDGYVVPGNFFHQLAEATSVTHRGDIYTNALLLTISKLKPLITKKLNVRWTDVQQI